MKRSLLPRPTRAPGAVRDAILHRMVGTGPGVLSLVKRRHERGYGFAVEIGRGFIQRLPGRDHLDHERADARIQSMHARTMWSRPTRGCASAIRFRSRLIFPVSEIRERFCSAAPPTCRQLRTLSCAAPRNWRPSRSTLRSW